MRSEKGPNVGLIDFLQSFTVHNTMDDQFDDIMERIRARQNQLSDDNVKENGLPTAKVVKEGWSRGAPL